MRWLVLGVIVFCAVILWWILLAINQFNEECKALGGHTYDRGRVTLCLSPDGRVLEP